MYHIDLTNDAPMIEPAEVFVTGIVHITTVTNGLDEDTVHWTPAEGIDEKPQTVPVAASARSRNTMGKSVIQYSIRERDLPGFGTYAISCWTRRGQRRTYVLTFEPFKSDVTAPGIDFHKLTIGASSTPCSWVTGEDIYVSKGSPVEIMLSTE